jgi:hypothetical protein
MSDDYLSKPISMGESDMGLAPGNKIKQNNHGYNAK